MVVDPVIDQLKNAEGLRLVVYDDATGKTIGPGSIVKGHPTIAYGRALDVNGLTPAEADYLLANDVAATRAKLSKVGWWLDLDAPRQNAIVCMAFQLGVAGMLSFRKMIAAIQKQDWAIAGQEALASGWAEETPKRAQFVAHVLATGAWPT
ncbi:MAG: glycoside hydrolase family protein [Negativicutes bacterium]|nr:glycoside hydrolase family protein [Negativicutes bacterium]